MYKIPTYVYEKDEWSTTEFSTRDEFIEFLDPLFKEPGQYEFDESSSVFNKEGLLFPSHDHLSFSAFQ